MAESIFWFRGFHRGATDAGSLAFHSACFCRLSVMLAYNVNLLVIPLVGAVDTLWIGRMGSALALAGQGAANQCFFSAFFVIAFIPTITAPLVAKAAGGGDIAGARKRICEALFLANFLGAIGTLLLAFRPEAFLSAVLPAGAPATEYAVSYLRLRSLSLWPASEKPLANTSR